MWVRGLVTAAGAAVALSGRATAQTQNWNNVAGGPAATANNWNPVGVPTATSALVYNLANTYAVSWNLSVPTVASHTFKKGTVTLSGTANAFGGDSFNVTGPFRVGDVSGDVATVTISTGIFSAASVTVGNALGSTGTLNLTDSDADIKTIGGGDIVVGAAGTGTMNITGGGHADAADDFIIGSAGGDGTVSVSGIGFTPTRFSSLKTNGADGDLIVGNSSGTVATLTVGASGVATSSDDTFVGMVGGASGVVDVGGILTVTGDLGVGFHPTSTTAGAGFVTALDGGAINVAGAIRLGDTTAGSGTLSVREGGQVTTHSLIMDNNGGFLNLLGGELTVDGGVLSDNDDLLTIDGTPGGESPVLALENGASCGLSATVAPFRALVVGQSNVAGFNVFNGSSLSVSSGDIDIAELGGSLGRMQVGSGGTLTFPASRTLVVGKGGDGGLVLFGGAQVTGGSMTVAQGAGSVGTLSLGPSTLTLATNLAIGGTPTTNGGAGSATIDSGGTISVTGADESVSIRASGSMVVNAAGTLEAAGLIEATGNFTLAGGTVDAAALRLGVAGSPYSLTGLINGELICSGPGTITNLTGPLTINGDTTPLTNFGTLNIGNHTLTVNSAFFGNLNQCTLGATGRLQGTAPIKVESTRTLSGDGVVASDLTNLGHITATGDGLTFEGTLTGVGQGVSGVRFTFADGGGFVGAGNIPSKIVGQQGSKITISGNSVLGDGTTAGFITDGELDITGSLNASDSNGIGLGSLTTLRGATLICSSAVNLGAAPTLDVLQGAGVVNGAVNCAGVIRPGTAGADETAQINFIGAFALQSGAVQGRLEIDLAGTAVADRDQIFVQGAPTLAGTLKVRLINGFVPNNGFSAIVVFSSGAISGSFIVEDLPARFHLEYDPTQVRVVFCAADFNSDGFVDGLDSDDFNNAFDLGDPSADYNGDGFVDGLDSDAFNNDFEGGC